MHEGLAFALPFSQTSLIHSEDFPMKRLVAGLSCMILCIATTSAVKAQAKTNKEVDAALKIVKTSKDAKARADAIAELGNIANVRTAFLKPAIPDLINLLKDGDANIRRGAAQLLGLIGMDAKVAVPDLIAVLDKGQDGGVRSAAAQALATMRSAAGDAIPALLEVQKEQTALDEKARNNQLLQDVNQALGTIQASFKEDADQTIGTLKTGADAKQRLTAVAAVVKLAKTRPAFAPPAYAALVEAWIKDRDNEVRQEIGKLFVGNKPDPKLVIAPLTEYLKENHDKITRVTAATLLGGLKADAKDALPLLTDIVTKENAKPEGQRDQDLLSAVQFALRRIQAATKPDEKQ